MDEYMEAGRELADQLLARELPRRWSHVAAVAKRAEEVAPVLDVDTDLLVSAAWLHDIGYASQLVDTGFHPLDGARFLRGRGFPDRLASLVAHHSCAVVEAELRGLAVELEREFPREESLTVDALWFCDMTTGPDGQQMRVDERLDEVRSRYGMGDVVTQALDLAEADLMDAAGRTEKRLRSAGMSP